MSAPASTKPVVVEPVELTPAFAFEAAEAETRVKQAHGRLGIDYLKFASELSNFKAKKYFLALDFKNFDEWAESPALQGIGWRTARNLIRIVDEAIPLIDKFNLMELLPSISTMYDLLPLLADGEDKFIEGLRAVQGLSSRDAKAVIRELRGKTSEEKSEPIFQLEYKDAEGKRYVRIMCSTEDTFYEVANGKVFLSEWEAFEKLFKGNVKIIE